MQTRKLFLKPFFQELDELSSTVKEDICKNYLEHHQHIYGHARDQSLGLSYHSRLCDYRIMSEMEQKGML